MRLLALPFLIFSCSVTLAAAPFPKFEMQEIDKTLKVGYGIRLADLNGDGKLDIVVADAARVIWFSNPDWKLHPIIDNATAGVKPDNVCLDVHDIDADGKLDIALGADWQPNNTTGGGSLQWLRQGETIDQWTVHPIEESIPTLHRIHFAQLDRDAKAELIVGPLKGKGSTAEKDWSDKPLELAYYSIEADPTKKWKRQVLDDTMHVMHNFLPFSKGVDKPKGIYTASYEGVRLIQPRETVHVGTGNVENPGGSRGSSEVKLGLLGDGPPFVATIEPFHGHQVVAYVGKERIVIDEQFKSGHALWCADLNGDKVDDIVAGFRDPTEKGMGPGVRVYQTSVAADGKLSWTKHIVDEKGMATEDLACGDLDADGDQDVVAAGRATGNVRIYWNQGSKK